MNTGFYTQKQIDNIKEEAYRQAEKSVINRYKEALNGINFYTTCNHDLSTRTVFENLYLNDIQSDILTRVLELEGILRSIQYTTNRLDRENQSLMKIAQEYKRYEEAINKAILDLQDIKEPSVKVVSLLLRRVLEGKTYKHEITDV